MTAPGVDERLHRDAVVAALTADLNGHVYDFGRVPGTKGPDETLNPGAVPDIWVQLAIERRFLASSKSPRRAHRSGWRLILRAVGRTPDEVRWALLQATSLEGTRLTVDSSESTPLQHEPASDDAIKPDGGRFSAAVAFTYVL